MTRNNAKERPRSRGKSSAKNFWIGGLSIVLIVAAYMYWPVIEPRLEEYRQSFLSATGHTTKPSPPPEEKPSEKKAVVQQAVEPAPPGVSGEIAPAETGTVERQQEKPAESDASLEPQQPLPGGDDPVSNLIDELNGFYSYLDQQPYMQDFALKEPSKDHFSKLLQKLMDNPPVVIRETDDILTLLKNTAHFYRILDKENIIVLKGILDRDRKSLEQMLKTFYALTYHPDALQNEYSLTLYPEALRDYAAFFLNTIGGRLYLFRRDSASRMAVSYYAILVIDRANQEGNNPQGIDIRPAIDSLIGEIEDGGKNLKFRDEYLERLYDLKERYN